MRTKFWLYCARATEGGMNLIRALGGKRIKADGGRFRYRKGKVVLNWGTTEQVPYPVKNFPEAVAEAVNKTVFFQRVKAARREDLCVPATNDPAVAQGWLKEGSHVLARTVLNGHSGAGIVVVGPKKGVLPEAQLYTKYIPKDEEYRIHIIRYTNGPATCCRTIFQQKKVKRKDFGGKYNRMVRNHDNGYTYQHTNIEVPKAVTNAAETLFLTAMKLDFGAVDVIFCREANKAYVLEINTAPGLDETTAAAYAKAFQQHF